MADNNAGAAENSLQSAPLESLLESPQSPHNTKKHLSLAANINAAYLLTYFLLTTFRCCLFNLSWNSAVFIPKVNCEGRAPSTPEMARDGVAARDRPTAKRNGAEGGLRPRRLRFCTHSAPPSSPSCSLLLVSFWPNELSPFVSKLIR